MAQFGNIEMNKYKNINPESLSIPEVGADRQIDQYGIGGGIRFDVTPRQLQLDESCDLTDVRFFGETLAKDYGYTAIGADAPATIRGMSMYRVSAVDYLVRMFDNGGFPDLEVSSDFLLGASANWTSPAASATAWNPARRISFANLYDLLIFTNGSSRLQRWNGTNITVLDAAAPQAQYVASFGTRILAFTNNVIEWPVSAIPTDWTGSGSGTVILGESNDEILGGAQVGHNTFIMFRRRSIWKAFQTGNVSQAVGFTILTDRLGLQSESGFCPVGGAIAFVGNDYGIYLIFADGSLDQIGFPIDKEFKRTTLNTNSSITYNHSEGEIWTGFSTTGHIWAFDLKRYFATQKKIWRRKAISSYAFLSDQPTPVPLFFSSLKTFISLPTHTTKNGSSFTGHSWSRPLNVGGELASLSLLTLYYTSPSTSSITVKTSGDGGVTVKETKSNVAVPAAVDGGVITIALNTTGVDVRFKIEFDQTVDIRITGYHPTIIHRGSVEYD